MDGSAWGLQEHGEDFRSTTKALPSITSEGEGVILDCTKDSAQNLADSVIQKG